LEERRKLSKTKKKKPYGSTAVLGVLSLASYLAIFTNLDLVMDYFIRGGIYAALPIAAALIISFIHGAFASGVLSIAGLSAKGH
jgi:hypothetical protein